MLLFFFFFFLDGRCTTLATLHQPLKTTPATTKQAGQHHKTRTKSFFFSPVGVPVTIKQEQNSSTEFFEGIVLRAVLPPIRKSPTTQESKQALILCYSL
jgi:uncharacterized RmlC-like cupin family protein